MNRNLLLSILLLLTSWGAFAQEPSLRMKLANKKYDRLAYSAAIPLYQDVLKHEPGNLKAMVNLADSYQKVKDTRNAERLYSDIVKRNDAPKEAYLHYAQALAENNKYESSREWFLRYEEARRADKRSERFARSYATLGNFFADSVYYTVYYTSLNSGYSEFGPAYYKSGLAFASSRPRSKGVNRVYEWDQSPFLDLYFAPDTTLIKDESMELRPGYAPRMVKTSGKAYRFNDDDTPPTSNDSPTLGYTGSVVTKDSLYRDETGATTALALAGDINSKFHEGPMTFFPGGDSVIFTRNNFVPGKVGKSNDGTNKLKLYTARYKDGKWTAITELPFNNDEYSVGHPTLTPDGKRLYFTSDMPGGYGGTDLYVSTWANGKWSKPLNLGNTINTEGNEMFPFVAADDELFFSSDGLGGLGGLDIFRAKLGNGEAEYVANMSFPINSRKDDFGIIVNKSQRSGYFASNRKRGQGDDDIYRFTYTPPVNLRLEGIVLWAGTETPIDSVDVQFKEIDNLLGKAFTPEDGKFRFNNIRTEKQYEVVANKPGLRGQIAGVSTKGVPAGGVVYVKIYMDKDLFFALDGTVINRTKRNPVIGDTVTLRNLTTKEELQTITDQFGRFHFELEPGNRYEVTGKEGSIKTNTVGLSTQGKKESEVFTALLYLNEPNECETVRMKFFVPNIYYDLDKSNIRLDAEKTLEHVLKLMTNFPEIKMELGAHTDSRASRAYNVALSKNRVEAAIKWLVARGIDRSRLTFAYHGEEKLVNNCGDGVYCPENEHQYNRRTEFNVILNGENITRKICK
jgi:outer membrane protein OmpA-like peptidoglycan-associated protein